MIDKMAEASNKLLTLTVVFLSFCASGYARRYDVAVDEVHIVYMNHLDVGYDGIPRVGFINNVLNQYFTVHFPRAINVTKELKAKGYTETFIYTTHPWLAYMYLNCPQNFTLTGVKLQCPSTKARTDFITALTNGDISYHAGPMNMQMENMNQLLFEMSLNISLNLDSFLGIQRKFRTLSQRDVPGMTHAAIPTMVKKDIVAVSVGVNEGTSPPAVPKIFTWKYDDANQVIAMWHPGGYPDNPGPYPSRPGGISTKDCVTIDGFSKALCFGFRTDNSGPPVNAAEVLGYYEILRAEFPGAKLFASTFEKFIEAIQPVKDQLPVVSNEIGDTWICGIASDPRKTAEYRVVMQTLTACIQNGACDPNDPRVTEAVVYLTKLGEHTWGLPSVGDHANWANQNFERVKSGQNYQNCDSAWLEQRQFTFLAIDKLGDHPIVMEMKQNLQKLVPQRPSLTGFNEVDPSKIYNTTDGVEIGFSQNGSISHLYDPFNKENWAKSASFGQFIYHSYDEGDFNHTNELYSYEWWIFTKPNLTVSSNPKRAIWATKLDKLYKSTGNDFTFLVKIVMQDPTSYVMYGAPREVWIKYTYMQQTASQNPGFSVQLQWFDKTPTRNPECLMYYFSPLPNPPLPPPPRQKRSGWTQEFEMGLQEWKIPYGDGVDTYSWSLKKLGYSVDPSNIRQNGSQYIHAVDSDVLYTTAAGKGLRVVGQDTPLVSLGTIQTFPSPFPVPLSPIEQGQINGFAFNMYNNMWDTNYIFWYPYMEGDENFSARFQIYFQV